MGIIKDPSIKIRIIKEPPRFIVLKLILLILVIIGAYYGIKRFKSSSSVKKSTIDKKKMRINNTPLKYSVKDLKIIFSDSVFGRPVYTVIFPDSTGYTRMYPEEIANGLATGVWRYNEEFKLIEENKQK
jgi:hypothetical protein